MKIIKPEYTILSRINKLNVYRKIEYIGRVSYKSEDKMTKESSEEFVQMIINNKHFSVIEHVSLTIKFIVSRGFSHELVRHRLASYTQESTRFVNYGKEKHGGEIKVIAPTWLDAQDIISFNNEKLVDDEEKNQWYLFMLTAERQYLDFINLGFKPEYARDVLPTAVKTEIIATANLREWRTILEQRTAKNAHPEMRVVMRPLLSELKQKLPIIFDDITYKI